MPRDLVLRYPGVPRRSRVRIARGSLRALGVFARATLETRRIVVVSDRTVARAHGAVAMRALAAARIAATLVVIPPGERSKSPAWLATLWRRWSELGLERGDGVVALGGGVVGDLAGVAAATYLRGLSWVCVPTTVLAQVDSSVGGKTGIDLAAGKNLVGAFHQPAGVLIDPDTLATLPKRQRRAGLAEVVKAGMAVDAALFRWTERHAHALAAGEPDALAEAVARAVRAKARVVTADEREREGGGRAALNFGHTLGHALEATLGYRGVLHGEAVAVGMRVAARLSVRAAGLDPDVEARLGRVLDQLGLPRVLPRVAAGRLMRVMGADKKRRDGEIRWVLTPHLGHASVPRLLPVRLVRAALIEAGARR